MQTRAPLKFRFALTAALAIGLSAIGCAGNIDPSLLPTGSAGSGGSGTGGTSGTAPCDAVTMLLGNANKCATAGACHAPGGPGGLDLMSPGIVARLVGKMANPTLSCASNAMPYLVANSNPPMGLLLTKLMNPAPCGSPMPFVDIGGPLSDGDRACINDWALAATQGRISQ
jgi:hypothetical protein